MGKEEKSPQVIKETKYRIIKLLTSCKLQGDLDVCKRVSITGSAGLETPSEWLTRASSTNRDWGFLTRVAPEGGD